MTFLPPSMSVYCKDEAKEYVIVVEVRGRTFPIRKDFLEKCLEHVKELERQGYREHLHDVDT